MPAPLPFSSPNQSQYPALYLYPLNDSFLPKHIVLSNNQRVKIGRQTNVKTAPGERNGYFDSKVLSRQHAEVWEDNGKIYIKDVKSSNGTFINGERLSPEGVDSDPWPLNSDDIVEFGIDIVGDDNKTIIHHKVAARVVCVFSEQDLHIAQRAEQHQQHQQQQYQQSQQPSTIQNQPGPSSVNGNPTFNFAATQQRRPQLSQQGLAGMGGMGGSMRPPGKSGLTFDHILNRLQVELQKSRETGTELNSLTGAMNEIHDTLGGGLPPNLPPHPTTLPPVRPQPPSQEPVSQEAQPSDQPPTSSSPVASTAVISDLQSQLQSTQSSLAAHVEKIRALEGVLAEQESIKHEVRSLREMIESRRREIQTEEDEKLQRHLQDHATQRRAFDFEEDDDHDQDSDDDARSINTIIPHELESVEEEDEEQLAEEERREHLQNAQDQESEREHEQLYGSNQEDDRVPEESHEDEGERGRDELGMGRPRTPEPTHLGLRDSDSYDPRPRNSTMLSAAPRRSTSSSPPRTEVKSSHGMLTDEVFEQIMNFSVHFGAVMTLTSTLEQQHAAAQSTIQALERKVETLEATLKAQQESVRAPPPPQHESPKEDQESLTELMSQWKKSLEGQWTNVQEEWNEERERLSKAREEWESKVRQMDSGLEKLATLQSSFLSQRNQDFQLLHQGIGNGDAVKHNGLVTPPSPRSQSSDSNRYRRRRRRSGASGRNRSASRSRSGSRDGLDIDTDTTLASEESNEEKDKTLATTRSLFPTHDEKDTLVEATAVDTAVHHDGEGTLATPESSVYKLSHSSQAIAVPESTDAKGVVTRTVVDPHSMNLQAAIGVLVLSVAAAAVFYRVKSD